MDPFNFMVLQEGTVSNCLKRDIVLMWESFSSLAELVRSEQAKDADVFQDNNNNNNNNLVW